MKKKSISDQCLAPNQLIALENLFNRSKSDESVNVQKKKNESSKLKLLDFKRLAKYISSHHNSESSLLNLKNFKNKFNKYRHKHHHHHQHKNADSNSNPTVRFENNNKENEATKSMIIINVPSLVEENKTNNQQIDSLNGKVDSVKSVMMSNFLRIAKNEVGLKELEQKANNLQERALDFNYQTSRFNALSRNREKMKLYISIVLLLIILLVFLLSILVYYKSQLFK